MIAELQSPIHHSLTLPTPPNPSISRDNLVRWLHDRFTNERKVIIVRGSDGAGKTTLLGQFVRAYPEQCFSFFVGTDAWSSSGRRFLQEMCAQMYTVVESESRGLDDSISDAKLKQLFETYYRRAAKKSRRTGRAFYFVVDGLDWTVDSLKSDSVLNLLPHDPPDGLYLLASSNLDQVVRFQYESWPIPLFSPTETVAYLSDMGFEKSDIERIHEACDGMPGYLAQIRREVQCGTAIEHVLANLPRGFRNLLEREWNRVSIKDERILDSLAVLAFSDTNPGVTQLAQVVGVPDEDLRDQLAKVPTLQFDTNRGLVGFVTDAHKRFTADKLSHRRGRAEAMLIRYYERDPLSTSAMQNLPSLLHKNVNQKDEYYSALKRIVNMDYLMRVLQQEHDLDLMRRNVSLVGDAAFKMEDWEALFQFALTSSILKTLSTVATGESEIQALLAMGDYQQSFERAYSAPLPVDRLHLLAKVASYLARKSISVSESVLSDLEHTVAEVKPAGDLWERVAEIAADLFYVHHQAAMDLIEKMSGSGDGKTMDVILASLSLKLKSDEADSVQMLRSRISDQSLRDFVQVNSPIVAELMPEQVIAEASQIEDTSAKLYFLRSWCNANRGNASAARVVREALEITTSSSDYSPSMRHLRQFAEPLLACQASEVSWIVERLDLLKAAAIKTPPEEKIRLDLVLASVEAHEALDKARSRLFQTYFDLDGITELDSLCYCLVRILLGLPKIDPTDERLSKEIEDRLVSEYERLLHDSADHLAVTIRLLRALTNCKPEMAVSFAGKLNTRERRDYAYREILRVYADREPAAVDLDFIEAVLNKISEDEKRNWATVRILEQFALKDMFEQAPQSRRFINVIAGMCNPRHRSYAYTYTIQMMATDDTNNTVDGLFEKMMRSWEAIDPKWEQIGIGFNLVVVLAERTPSLARRLFEQIEIERAATPLSEELFAELYMGAVELAIRAFPDVLKGQNYQSFRNMLIVAISQIPSPSVQAQLLSNLALQHHLVGKRQDFEQIVKERVLQALDSCHDTESRIQCIIATAPCLFIYERNLMLAEVSLLPYSARDTALRRVVAYLLSKRLPSDPLDWDSMIAEVDYKDALQICDVLKQMNTDVTIYSLLDKLVTALIRPDPSRPEIETCILQEKQAIRIAKELGEIVASKFPDPDNIQHTGFQIGALASIAHLRSSVFNKRVQRATEEWTKVVPSWEDIAQAAEGIPNSADEALVMAWIGCRMFASEPKLAYQILEKAKSTINGIPNIVDRADRLQALAAGWHQLRDKESAKTFLEEAMSILNAWRWDQTRDRVTAQILQLAHTLDPEFAGSLTSTVDNPVIRDDLKQNLSARDLQHRPENLGKLDEERMQSILGGAAERLLTSFCSGRGYAQQERVVGKWMRCAVDAPFDDAYTVLAWSIENSLARTRELSGPVLTSTFMASLETLAMIQHTGQALLTSSELGVRARSATPSMPSDLELFPVGNESSKFLRKWLAENAGSHVMICDPYFTVADLHVLKSIKPESRVDILTKWMTQRVPPGDQAVRELYQMAWDRMCDQRPPETHIHIVGVRSNGDGPIHDRYVIIDDRGINLGTSLSGLDKKDVSIHHLSSEEVAKVIQEIINPLLLGTYRLYKGESLMVYTITLVPSQEWSNPAT